MASNAILRRLAPLVDLESYAPPDDTEFLVGLFNSLYPARPIPDAYPDWRYALAPLGGETLIARYRGAAIGAFSYNLIDLVSARRGTRRCAFAIDAMIVPELQNVGFIVPLAHAISESACRRGADLIFGLANDTVVRTFCQVLDWRHVRRVSLFVQPGSAVRARLGRMKSTLRALILSDVDGELCGELADRAVRSSPGRWFLERSPTYLTWRYRQNPWYRYRVTTVADGETLIGYAIWKSFLDRVRMESSLDVVDFVCTAYPSSVRIDALAAALGSAISPEHHHVSIWADGAMVDSEVLSSLGFSASQSSTNLVARPLNVSQHDFDEILGDLCLAMGDSEVF